MATEFPHGELLFSFLSVHLSFLFTTALTSHCRYPTEKHNMTALAPSKNVQKRRKALMYPQSDERQNVYWDLRGRYQQEYDKRLDAMPDEGKGQTKASEIFRAASKLYYDFWNNAMVNNTSGAVNTIYTLAEA